MVPGLTVTFPNDPGESVRFVGGAGPAGGQVPAGRTRGVRLALLPPTTAVVLGALAFTLTVLYVPFAPRPATLLMGAQVLLLGFLAFALRELVMARRQPGNPIGWILIGLGVLATFYADAGRHAVFDYHFHRGGLPFGPAAAWVASGCGPGCSWCCRWSSCCSPMAACRGAGGGAVGPICAAATLVAAYFLGAAAWATAGPGFSVDGPAS